MIGEPATLASLYWQNFSAVLWTLLLLLSFYGWGSLLRLPAKSCAITALLGLSIVIFIGSILNVLEIAFPATNILIVAIGLAIACFRLKPLLAEITDHWRWLCGGSAAHRIIVALVVIRLAFFVYEEASEPRFFVDDFHAYLAQPTKIVQTGSLGVDPFSERRMSSLGGQPWLLALVASAVDLRHIRLVDGGIGIIFYAAFIILFFRARGAPKLATLFVLALCLLFPPGAVNLTANVLGAAVFAGLALLLIDAEIPNRASIIQIGLVAGAMCTLKATLALGAIVTVCFWLLWRAREFGVAKTFSFAAGIATIALVEMSVWMWLSKQSNGTFFYPLLGKGWHGSAQGLDLFDPWSLRLVKRMLKLMIRDTVLISALFLPFIAARRSRDLFAIGAAVLTACFMTQYATRGTELRYSDPYMHVAVIFSVGVLFAWAAKTSARWKHAGLGIIILIFAIHALSEARHMKYFLTNSFWHPERAVAAITRRVKSYSAAQYKIPRGAGVMERLNASFAVDFRRNRIFICDIPGGSSPPPGMPIAQTDDGPLVDYLLRHGVEYLMFTYKDRLDLPDSLGEMDDPARFEIAGPWVRHQLDYAFKFRQHLIQLSRTKAVFYDDGEVRVINLRFSWPPPPPPN